MSEKIMALFLKERTEPDPKGVINLTDFEMEFSTFMEGKGFKRPKGYVIDAARRGSGLKVRSGLNIYGVDYDGEVFNKGEGWATRGFLGVKWKHKESLRLRSSNKKENFRALSAFKYYDIKKYRK